ncbi:hypothetical protein D3C80_725060 [compost metagenome]
MIGGVPVDGVANRIGGEVRLARVIDVDHQWHPAVGNSLAHDPQEQLGQAEAIGRGVVLQPLQARRQLHLGYQSRDQAHHRAQRIPHPVFVLGPGGVVLVQVGIAGAIQLLCLGHAAGLWQVARTALDSALALQGVIHHPPLFDVSVVVWVGGLNRHYAKPPMRRVPAD